MEINVDIGGTFTDCVATREDGSVVTAKALTTHHNLALGFMRAVEDIAGEQGGDVEAMLAEVRAIRYATTLGTNALIERSGPRLGVLGTMGHEATVPIGRCRQWADGLPPQVTRDLPRAERPVPLVIPDHIVGLRERLDYAGRVIIPLSEDEVRRKVQDLVDLGVRGFVVSLLHANVNPVHEQLVRRVIHEEYPSAYLGRFPVICSHEESGRAGEYVRTMTSIIDAYLHRATGDRLSALRDDLRERGYRGQLLLVHNSGGMGTLAQTAPVQTVHAGPVAGLHGSRQLAEVMGHDRFVTTDMGGTSFDVGIVVDGSVSFYEAEPVIDRWAVQMPMMEINALGAGGGSIARLDAVSGVAVGPESAGSTPGPACYGLGGTEPTVTDANLVLGYLDPDRYHGGELPLDRRRAERAIERRIAGPLGIDVVDAARRIRQVVDAAMADEIFTAITVKGYDPREFWVCSFGGGGPLHACGYADVLDAPRVVIPPHSSVFSASGAAGLEFLRIYERSVWLVLFNPLMKQLFTDFDRFNAIVDDLRARALRDFGDDEQPLDDVRIDVELDVRSTGQIYVITVPCPVERIEGEEDLAAILKAYFAEYEERFGESALAREVGVSIDAIRVRASIPRALTHPAPAAMPSSPGTPEVVRRRDAWWRDLGMTDTPVYEYPRLVPGDRIDGPAILEASDTTVLVEPGWRAEMDARGFLMMDKEAQR